VAQPVACEVRSSPRCFGPPRCRCGERACDARDGADEVGVRAWPVGAGVTVGEGHRDYDRDRDRDRTTVIKEHEPRDRETVIKKEREDGVESKTTIHRDND
jgi:hypothetical protein